MDERIAGLKEAEKRAKADAKGKKTAQTTQTEKSAKTAGKTVKKGADTTAVVESKALAVIPKNQPTTATVAQAV
ncbi:hypothetical protein [Coprobacter sp.]